MMKYFLPGMSQDIVVKRATIYQIYIPFTMTGSTQGHCNLVYSERHK
jgi:hypothetical protein